MLLFLPFTKPCMKLLRLLFYQYYEIFPVFPILPNKELKLRSLSNFKFTELVKWQC